MHKMYIKRSTILCWWFSIHKYIVSTWHTLYHINSMCFVWKVFLWCIFYNKKKIKISLTVTFRFFNLVFLFFSFLFFISIFLFLHFYILMRFNRTLFLTTLIFIFFVYIQFCQCDMIMANGGFYIECNVIWIYIKNTIDISRNRIYQTKD